MACGAPALWVSILLIAIGVVIAVLAVVPWFVIPDQVEKTVTDLAVIDSPDDDNFDDFVNPTENPLVYNCYFWNITNYDAVRTTGAKPNMVSVGPYVYKKYTHRFNISFFEDGEMFSYQEWADYNYSAEESFAGADPVNDFSWTVNVAWLAGIPGQKTTESQVLGQVAANAITTFKPSLVDAAHLISAGFINSAWASVFTGTKAAVGFTNIKNAWQAGVAPNFLTAPFADESGVFKALLDSGRGELVDILFNETVSGSLTDPTFAGQLTWTNSTLKVASLLATYSSFNLTLSEASNIFGYRATPNGKRNGGPLPGGTFYGVVINQVLTSLGLGSALPFPFVLIDNSTWANFENNVAWLHFGSATPAYFGLFNNASLIETPAGAAQAALLFGNIPELSIWVSRYLQNYFVQEGVSSFPERNVLKTPLIFPVNDSKWIFDTFGNTNLLPNNISIGVFLTNIFVSFFPNYLRSFPSVAPLFNAGNFSHLQETAWVPAAFPASFAAFINQAAPLAGLANTTGTTAQGLGLNRPLSFFQAFQIYSWIRWNWMDGFAIDLLYSLNGGPIIKQSPHQWLFGRNESFFSFAFGRPVPVGGIWSDFTPELGAKNNFIETYTTGKADPENFRQQITYNGNSSLAGFFPNLQPPPIVIGSSLTFIGPYRLISKTGSKKTSEKFYLWVPDVVRELELIFQKETSLFGIDLFRFRANDRYKTVVQDPNYINPYDFVMDNRNKYTSGAHEFYLTYPGWTLVKETNLFHDKVDGVSANEEEFSLFWDFEPVTGVAMRARAPLQLSLPVNHDSKYSATGPFNILGRRLPTSTHIPTWYIIRTNQIKKSQAEDWKNSVGAAQNAQLGITVALAAFGGIIFLVGLALLLWRLIGGAREDMQEFELRN